MDIYLQPRSGRVFRSMVPLAGSRMRFAGFGDSQPGTSSQEVLDVQGKLVQLGYTLNVTGSYDGGTSAAVLDFRQKMGLPVVDSIDASVMTAIGMAGRPEYRARFPGAGGMGMGAKVGIAVGAALIAWAIWG